MLRTEKKNYNRKLTDQQIIEAHKMHLSGESIVSIASKVGVTRHNLRKRFIVQGLKYFHLKSANTINHRFFQVIDSEIKAYLLGFIAGDGSIKDTNKKYLSIDIQGRDKYLIDLLIQYVNPGNNPIFIKAKKKQVERFKFDCHSVLMIKDLQNVGIIERKSFNPFKFNNIPKHLRKDIIRGLLDADGCVYQYKSGRVIVHIVSTSLPLLDQILNWLAEENIHCTISKNSDIRKTQVYTLGFYSQQDVINIKEYLYKDATFFFQRKFSKFCFDNTELTKKLKDLSSVTTT